MFDDTRPQRDSTEVQRIQDVRLETDLPIRLDVLPDGRAASIWGDPEGFGDYQHPPGDNAYGFENTSALVLCESSLRRFEVDVGEADLVRRAVERGLCEAGGDARLDGAVPLDALPALLGDFGLPAHVERGYSLEDLALHVENGSDVLVALDAAALDGQAMAPGGGEANRLVAVTALARDPDTDELLGVYVHDASAGEASRFVDARVLVPAWLDTGGWLLVTDVVHLPE